MKIKLTRSYQIYYAIIAFLAIFLSGLYLSYKSYEKIPESTKEYVVFTTVAIKGALPTISPYELHRASEHMSDIILTWTLEPGFAKEFSGDFTGKRQEMQNLIFTVRSEDKQDAQNFVNALNARLSEYNSAQDVNYALSVLRITELEIASGRLRYLAGLTILTFILASLFATAIYYGIKNRSGLPSAN